MIVPKSISLILFLTIAILCQYVAVAVGVGKDSSELKVGADPLPELDNDDAEFSDFDDLEYEEDVFSFLRFGRRTQSTSQSSRANIFQKLGESLGTTIVGCLLIALMPCLIWKNEGRHVNELSRIDYCKNNAVVVDW
jgi:hypothetical protein